MANLQGKVLGHAPCPYCGDKTAEVKLDKNAAPYLVCFLCGGAKKKTAQHFTHGEPKLVAALLGGGKFKPLAGVELPECLKFSAPAPAGDPAPKPAGDPKPAPARKTLLG